MPEWAARQLLHPEERRGREGWKGEGGREAAGRREGEREGGREGGRQRGRAPLSADRGRAAAAEPSYSSRPRRGCARMREGEKERLLVPLQAH